MALRRVKIANDKYINLDANPLSCSICAYRDPWKSFCKLYKCSLEKVSQKNNGFHHNRCEKCKEAERIHETAPIEIQEQRVQLWLKNQKKLKIGIEYHTYNAPY